MRFHRRGTHDYGEPWDASDVKALRRLHAKGLTAKQIAQRMGRSVGGVRGKLYRLRKASD